MTCPGLPIPPREPSPDAGLGGGECRMTWIAKPEEMDLLTEPTNGNCFGC